MITLESAESALKNIYLDAVINDINTKTNPFLTMISGKSKTAAGKEIKLPIRYGDNGNVAAMHEDGDLPISTNSKYAEISVPLKNLYGTFQISDKAIRSSQDNASVFANLLGSEMENLVKTAQGTLNTMLYGNGMTLLGCARTYDASGGKFKVDKKELDNFKVGMDIVIYDGNNKKLLVSSKITAINAANGEITHNGFADISQQERYYVYTASSETDKVALNGIDSIFMQDGKIYNLDTTIHTGIKPYSQAHDVAMNVTAGVNIMNEDTVLSFLDGYEEHCNGVPADILLTHPMVRKALFENLKAYRSNIDTVEMAGGFKGFTFNGIPLHADVKCKGGTLYALNSESFSMYQLCDWTWLSGDDGAILHQIGGKAAYQATLVKYADLICEKPFLQGKISGYAVKRWKEGQSGADFKNVM